MPLIYDRIPQSTELVLDSIEVLTDLTERALGNAQNLWIILDGLDECNRKERKRIVTWITMIAERCGNLCVLISQSEVDIRRLLLHMPPLDLQEFPEH
jgi:hypothetical protein